MLLGIQRGAQLITNDTQLLNTGPGARPEEAAQAVALATWHDMQVEVRDRLADDVVLPDEGALGAEYGALRERDQSGSAQDLGVEVFGQVVEGFVVLDRADQGMAGEERVTVEEGDHPVGAQDDLGREFTGDDLVENVHGSQCDWFGKGWGAPDGTEFGWEICVWPCRGVCHGV